RRTAHGQLRDLGRRREDRRVPPCALRHQGGAARDQKSQAPGAVRPSPRNGAMSRRLAVRLVRLGYAGAAGAGIGSFAFWTVYWFSFVRGNLRGPDFFNFYAAAKLYITSGGSAVYDLAMQRQVELQITGADPSRFVVLPYFHPPYYTLLIAPIALLDYRNAYYVMAALNVLLAGALIFLLVR